MTSDPELQFNWSVDPLMVRPVVRELLVIIALIIGMQLGFWLPGTNQPLLETTITGEDIILGLGTLGLVASLVDGAPKLDYLVTECVREPPEINEDAGRIGYGFVLFIAVLVAHAGFGPLRNPVVAIPWLYDLVFFLVALVPLASILLRVRAILDPPVCGDNRWRDYRIISLSSEPRFHTNQRRRQPALNFNWNGSVSKF